VVTRDLVTSLLELIGLALIVVGVWQIFRPAAWITAGVGLAFVGWRAGLPPEVAVLDVRPDQ
jgi:hypothetical protein